MTAEIIYLDPMQDDMVGTLEMLLDKARRGELNWIGVAGGFKPDDDGVGAVFSGDWGVQEDVFRALGVVEDLRFRVHSRIEQ